MSSANRKPQSYIQNLATHHHCTSRCGKGFRVFRLRCWEQPRSFFLSHAGQDRQVSEGQREFSVKNRLSGEQTGWVELSPMGLGVHSQKPCMPLSSLPPHLLNPSLSPDATFPVHLHTQTVHSVTDICLAPASGQVVFQARDRREEKDNNPSPSGAEILPEAKPSYLTPILSTMLPGHSSFTRPSPDALYCPEEPPWTYRSAHCNPSADPLTTTQNPTGTPWVGTFHSSRGLAGHMAPGPCQGRVVWLEQPSLFKFVNKYTYS